MIKEFKGYKINTIFSDIILASTILIIFIIMYFNGYNLNYYSCHADHNEAYQCKNPFYNEATAWQGQEYLMQGDYGPNPNKTVYLAELIVFALVICCLIINHLVYNRGFKIEVKE